MSRSEVAGSPWGRLVARLRGDPRARALRSAARRLERDGALVFADVEGWPRPPLIRGFVPALYAVFEDRELLLGCAEPERRDQAFLAWAEESAHRAYEDLVV
jgi:hypothetical protein